MKKMIYLLFSTLPVFFSHCASIKTSEFSKATSFTYHEEQPRFNFNNDLLQITGNWWWNSSARAIPKVSFLPSDVKKLLRPLVYQHGPLLFATWAPQSTKFSTTIENLPVTKKDVRRKHRFIKPFYEMALISDHPFVFDSARYVKQETNNFFSLFLNPPKRNGGYWVMETVAAYGGNYYNFICIMDSTYIKSASDSVYQSESFMADIRDRFTLRQTVINR